MDNTPAKQPVSDSPNDDPNGQDSMLVRAINRAIQSASHLAYILPTGTSLFFQFLLPIVSNGGKCGLREKIMTSILLGGCGIWCFLLSFTDTYKSSDGKPYYGFVTSRGLWIPQLQKQPSDASEYKLRFLDFVHGFLTLLVFAAANLFDPEVKSCFYPHLPDDLQSSIPVAVGFIASFLFILFPSRRRGLDYPAEGYPTGAPSKS